MQGTEHHRSIEVVHRPFLERPAELVRRKGDQEEKFAKIFRFNPVAMSIISAVDGRFMEVNPEFCRMTGYAREEAIGRTALELGLAWPESGRDVLVNVETGKPEPAPPWDHDLSNLEASIRHKSGDGRIVLVSCEQLELDGQECVLAAFRDITERRRMEEELRVMNLRLREWVVELERRTADINLLGQMADLLQTCVTSQEAYQVVANSSRLIFPEAAGVLYLREAGAQQIEAVATWSPPGNATSGPGNSEPTFEAEHCWALRMGRLHAMGFDEPALVCQHLLGSTANSGSVFP